MKMSNKIFLGLVLIVFAVPLLLAATLKSKINKGEYTVVKNNDENEENARKGTFASYKVIKVVSPHPELLMCTFQQSEEMNFKYNNYESNDSLTVFNQGDTLYIQFLAKPAGSDNQQGENNGYGKTVVSINLPVVERLMVDGAMVILDPAFANSDSLSVTLKNNASIKAGKEKKEEVKIQEPVSSIEKGEPKQISKVYQAGRGTRVDMNCMRIVRKATSEMVDITIKDILVNHLLHKI